MKMNKKGFTLIELLAVIVILAVIALIVTPIVTDIIATAKDSANARSVEAHVKNLEYSMLQASFKNQSGDTDQFDEITSESDLKSKFSDLGVSFPDNDHITCTTLEISNGTVMSADGCKESGWTKSYAFAQGSNAQVSPSE